MCAVGGKLVLTGTLCLSCACAAGAATITVDVAGSGDYLTIQEGLDAASASDTVLVFPGEYFERIAFNADDNGVVLVSAAGPESTVIDGTGTYDPAIVLFEECGPSTELRGFTVRGTGIFEGHLGGGVSCLSSHPLIVGNVIRDCWVQPFGGGIYLQHSNATVSANTITECMAGEGGGIYIYGGTPTITGNEIVDNEARGFDTYWGGGIYVCTGTSTITGNSISGNHSMTGGGAIHVTYWNTSVHLESNTISGNTSSEGCGGITVVGGYVEARGNIFSGNHCETDVAAIEIIGTGPGQTSVFENNIVFGNTSATGAAAVVVRRDQAPVFHSNYFVNPMPYELRVKEASSPDTLDFTGNWWGFTDASSIDARIWDSGDDPDVLVRVDFSDWCVEPECGGSATSVPDGDARQPTSWGHIKSLFRE